MLRCKHAFTLVEVMLYASINTIVILGVCSVSVQVYRQLAVQRKLAMELVNNNEVITLLQRDLMQADNKPSSWDDNVIFMIKRLDKHYQSTTFWIGWECRPQGVARISGNYDVTTRRWLKKNKTDLFPCTITTLACYQHRASHGLIKGATISYRIASGADKVGACTIALRNRYLR